MSHTKYFLALSIQYSIVSLRICKVGDFERLKDRGFSNRSVQHNKDELFYEAGIFEIIVDPLLM